MPADQPRAAGARQFAADNNIQIIYDKSIDRHFVNTLIRPPANFTAADIKQSAQLVQAVADMKSLKPDIIALGSFGDLCRNIVNEFKVQNYLPGGLALTQCMGQAFLDQLKKTGDNGAYVMASSGWDSRLKVRTASPICT